MNKPKVDVLAWFDDYIRRCGAYDDATPIRNAVAELIDADREFDSAADALAAAKREKGSWRTNPLGDSHPAVLRMRAAKARRSLALARIGGES